MRTRSLILAPIVAVASVAVCLVGLVLTSLYMVNVPAGLAWLLIYGAPYWIPAFFAVWIPLMVWKYALLWCGATKKPKTIIEILDELDRKHGLL